MLAHEKVFSISQSDSRSINNCTLLNKGTDKDSGDTLVA
jgi:hypothetical protein